MRELNVRGSSCWRISTPKSPPGRCTACLKGVVQDVVLERRVGSVGVMTLSSTRLTGGSIEGGGELQRFGEVSQERGVTVQRYEGRVKKGVCAGENVFVKMYPKTAECDALSANELKMHADLQPPHTERLCDQLVYLLGGYQTETANCLVFRRYGKTVSLGQYIHLAAKALQSGSVVGSADVWDVMDPRRAESKRQKFIVEVLRRVIQGLDFMHQNCILHQSLGPESVFLSNFNETDRSALGVQIGDLAFAVDASDRALSVGMTLGEIWDIASDKEQLRQTIPSSDELWTRARSAGAWSDYDKRNFGIADDILSLGAIDGPRLYRLVQTTFDSDLMGFREYCCEDERFEDPVAFLDREGKAGWELIQAMIQLDWKSRPTAASCLNHGFLSGALFENEL